MIHAGILLLYFAILLWIPPRSISFESFGVLALAGSVLLYVGITEWYENRKKPSEPEEVTTDEP